MMICNMNDGRSAVIERQFHSASINRRTGETSFYKVSYFDEGGNFLHSSQLSRVERDASFEGLNLIPVTRSHAVDLKNVIKGAEAKALADAERQKKGGQ